MGEKLKDPARCGACGETGVPMEQRQLATLGLQDLCLEPGPCLRRAEQRKMGKWDPTIVVVPRVAA